MKTPFIAALAILAGAAFAADEPKAPEPPPAPELPAAFGWDAEKQGHFPVSIAASESGEVWVGTEGNGIWRYSPARKTWTGYTTKDGLGDDDVYAVAVDQLGRVWAGHLNHGVSVFNGGKWKSYTSFDGPLGDRVFAIATCPTDGDVWIATDCGVTRYSLKRDDWDYFTRAAGLPSNQIQAIAFDPDGNVYLGTQCDGIAAAPAAGEYRTWTTIAGPHRMPNTPIGEGLPTNLINAVIFDPNDNSVNAITPLGLGGTDRDSKQWVFVRGEDWEANVRGLFKGQPPQNMPSEIKLPLEDWLTAIAIDGNRVWLGYRQRGFDTRDDNTGEPVSIGGLPSDVQCEWVRTILLPPNAPPLIAVYDGKTGGLKTVDKTKTIEAEEKKGAPESLPPFPSPAKAPDEKSLTRLAGRVAFFKDKLKPGDGYFLGDDWQTQGDWAGRYGRNFARLFGTMSPKDHDLVADERFGVEVRLGPHHAGTDETHAIVTNPDSKNARALYDPLLGHRREAEINDGSTDAKKYPFDWDGPDLWMTVKAPEGAHRVSLYLDNNDAHTGKNKFRDYVIEMRRDAGEGDANETDSTPLAIARVTDFAGGVYKQFVVRGPGKVRIRIARNRSFGTKLQGVFIDELSAPAAAKPATAGAQKKALPNLPGLEDVRYERPDAGEIAPPAGGQLNAALKLWKQLDAAGDLPGVAALQRPFRLLAYRAALAAAAPPKLLANWRWQFPLWTAADRDEFKATLERAWKSYLEKHPDAAKPDKPVSARPAAEEK
jgi:two component regulator with propeller domain